MAYGEYTMEGDANITPFFEVLYSRAETFIDSGTFQLFPDVGADNPFDERDARICATFAGGFFDTPACTPFLFGFGANDFVGPVGVTPIVGINGDRTTADVVIENTRLVGGFRGDLPFLNFGSFSDWSFEASLAHSISNGTSSRVGIRDDRLNFSLGNDIETGVPIAGLAPCTAAPGAVVRPDVLNGCVPVNLFAPSVFAGVAGDLSTQAERDYLFDSRDFDTEYKQTVWNAFASGKIAEVPAGNINAVVGVEYQSDQIESDPNEIARDGLFFGFFSDAGARGEKFVRSAYAEVDIPLVADKPLFRQLEVNLSARVLEDEFYGGASTQTGFLTLFDPCVVPAGALTTDLNNPDADQIYDPSLDGRDPDTLDRCRAEGLDPTTLGIGGNSFFSTEVATTGSLDLDPEESTSFTAGFSFEQPFTDAFDLEFGATYYDVDVSNSVVSPTSQFIINDCFVNDRDSRSPFCDRITRDDEQLLEEVNQGFINLNEDEVRGIDANLRLGKDFTMFDRNFDYTASFRANRILEVRSLFIGDDGTPLEENFEGEFGFPEWSGNLTQRLSFDDVSFTWGTRYVGSVSQDEDAVDDFGNAFGIDTDDDGFADTFSDTCGGPAVGDVNCRDVGFATKSRLEQTALK